MNYYLLTYLVFSCAVSSGILNQKDGVKENFSVLFVIFVVFIIVWPYFLLHHLSRKFANFLRS